MDAAPQARQQRKIAASVFRAHVAWVGGPPGLRTTRALALTPQESRGLWGLGGLAPSRAVGSANAADAGTDQYSNPNARGFYWNKLTPVPLPMYNQPALVVADGVRDNPPPRILDARLAQNETFQVRTSATRTLQTPAGVYGKPLQPPERCRDTRGPSERELRRRELREADEPARCRAPVHWRSSWRVTGSSRRSG